MLRKFHSLVTSQKSRFEASKRTDICSALLQDGRFADAQESLLHVAKLSNMGCALQQRL